MHPTAQAPQTQPVSGLDPAGGAEGGKLFIIALRCGRLANRISLFANFIAVAEEQGHRVINFTFHSYAHLFQATARDVYCQYPRPGRRSWLDVLPGVAPALRKTRILYHTVRAVGVLNERYPLWGRRVVTIRERPKQNVTALEGPEGQEPIAGAKVVFVHGFHFRAPHWMERHAEKIRAYFRPIEAHARASRQAVERLRRNADVVVGVHIRRGDYSNWSHGRYFFEVPRYAAWMREMAEQFPGRRVAFLIGSNEPRDAAEFAGLSVGFAPGLPVEDLYALAECDYVLGPVSSFTQWASFYGGKPLLHLRSDKDRVEVGKFRVCYLDEVPT